MRDVTQLKQPSNVRIIPKDLQGQSYFEAKLSMLSVFQRLISKQCASNIMLDAILF